MADHTVADMADRVAQALQAMRCGRGDKAVRLLAELHHHSPNNTEISRLLGFSLRQEQRYLEADTVFTQALELSPEAPALIFGQAQTRYELGLPAAALFERAQAVMPENREVLRNRAAAMVSEGDPAGAETLLRVALKQQPDWLDGLKALATLKWTHGDSEGFASHYADATRANPGDSALWLAWFSVLAQTRQWDTARTILGHAEQHIGTTPAIVSARLFVACEGDDPSEAGALLAATAQITGDTINLCRVRHALRQHRLDEAENLVLPQLGGESAGLFWPYASIIWRLLGDSRAEWLDRPGVTIQSRPLGLGAAEMAELADVLRALHTMEKPYVEQTVRGGTQTDRSVMLRHEPILQRSREAWMDAIRANIAALPAPEEGHPFLRAERCQLLLGGSWSVRLRGEGHNVPHTHPMGWMSLSLYVAVPDKSDRGPAPAGHITFGTPPSELGLDLKPYCSIVPEPGLVVTFPSMMWHAVVPFAAGERLMVALDIRPPVY